MNTNRTQRTGWESGNVPARLDLRGEHSVHKIRVTSGNENCDTVVHRVRVNFKPMDCKTAPGTEDIPAILHHPASTGYNRRLIL